MCNYLAAVQLKSPIQIITFLLGFINSIPFQTLTKPVLDFITIITIFSMISIISNMSKM